jgi:sterol desaturase/sphingolipid hydroxylase (fatty acid hydroxylase superfamily)
VVHALVNETLSALSVWIVPVLAAFVPWTGIWPTDWPLLAQWLIALLVADCGITLVHFWSHHSRSLWRLHAVHHSVERMYGLNGLMKHPLHQAIETLAGVSPLLLAGMPQHIAMLLAFSVTIQLLLQHSNVDVDLGILGRWLAVGATHRLHHLADPVRGNVNFGLFTTLWDRLLGTAVFDPCPKHVAVKIGLAGHPDYPTTYLAQLMEPFRPTTQVEEASQGEQTPDGIG